MKHGTKLEVSSGQGSFVCYFLNWIGSTDKLNAINRFGKIIIVSQSDILEMFI